MHSIVLDI